MGTWFYKELGSGVASFAPTEMIQKEFRAYVSTHEADMAVFSHYDSRSSLVTAYFTPTAEQLALSLGAVPCDKPIHIERLSLVVGHGDAREMHFPKH